ncbi:Ribosomal protein S6 kinase alpha-5 [Leucoagaricus sp. SymC.cos]|nr:Ribosomal protein S6 kinase alpha-5 [Leucoagaricus sp. SymC.cos]
MDSHPPAANEPDTLASLQLLLSQIDSASRAQEVANKANGLSGEETQILVDALSASLDKDNAFTRSQAHVCLALVKIASATNFVSRCRTIKSENLTPSTSDDESLGIFTITGQMPCQVKVVRQSQDKSSAVSGSPEDAVYAAQYPQGCSEELIRWAHLTHPNILPLYATFSEHNNLGFVSPRLPEISIRGHAQRLPKERRLLLILDVTDSLAYLHRLNIVHGRLTPEAVLLSSEGRALLAGPKATSEAEASNSLPVRYSAPEVLEDENIRPTKAVDIWSFACFSYEVLSGKVPFFQLSKDSRITLAITREDKPLRPGLEGVDGDEIIDEIWRLLLLCWEYEVGDRADCSRVQEMLTNLSVQDDRPMPQSPLSSDALDGCTIATERIKTVVNKVLGFEPPSTLQIPEHLHSTLFTLVDDADKRSARAAAANKLSPGETQVLVDILDLVVANSIHLPTARLLFDTMGSTHTIPHSHKINRVQYDPDVPIAEGRYVKAYKGRGLNVRVNVVTSSLAAARIPKWCSYWANSSHPNVLPFYGMFHEISNEAPRICVISPLLENGSLNKYAPTLPQKSRFPLVSDIVNGFAYLHNTWDVSPGGLDGETVLISNVGRVIIASLGSDYLFTEGRSPGSYLSYYWRFNRSPPSYQNNKKIDVWSLGCVCYEVLTRKVPYYQYPDDHEVVTRNSKAELPKRPDRSDDDIDEIDDRAWDLITKCCAQNPDDQASLSQIQEMLADFGLEDNRPTAKPLVGPEVLALRSRPEIDFDQAESALGKIQAIKLIQNRTKDVAETVAELESSDIRPVVDFLDQRYELKGVKYRPKPIAEGGFGNVHQGVDPSMCVKVMKRLDPDALTPWIKELILWAHSSHPNVLPFYGVFVQGAKGSPQTCLVSPFMKNGNLRDYAPRLSQKSRLPLVSYCLSFMNPNVIRLP